MLLGGSSEAGMSLLDSTLLLSILKISLRFDMEFGTFFFVKSISLSQRDVFVGIS